MKFAKYALLPIVAAVSLSVSATTYVFVPANDSIGTKLCISAVKNNVARFKNMAKDYRISNKVIANKVSCNDQNIANFAQRYDAMKTAAYINRFKKGRVTIRDLAATSNQKSDKDDVVIVTVN